MKKLITLFSICFFSLSFFSQTKKVEEVQEQETIVKKVLRNKTDNYFELRKILKNKNISIKTIERLKKKSEEDNYALGQVYALNIMSIHYRNNAEYEKAIKYLEQSIKITEKTKDRISKVVALNILGSVYKKMNNAEKALICYKKALFEAKKNKTPSADDIRSISISKNSIGNVYMTLNQYELALKQFNKAIKVLRDSNDLKSFALNYQNIGYALENLGDIDAALKNYNKSLEYNVEDKSVIGQIICYNSICRILIKKKEYEEALKVAIANYDRVKGLENPYYYCQTLNNLGLSYLKNNYLENAELMFQEALEVAKNHNYNKQKTQILFHLSELYDSLNNKEEAFHYYKEAVNKEREKTKQFNNLFVNNLVSKLDEEPEDKDIRLSQNEIKIRSYEANRNRNVLIITLISLALLSVALYSIYRQRLLNNDRQVLMLEQQALQAQMNPHFIFNALNSIKLYIINNEQKQAVFYLNKFSKLIRNILDVSKVKEVSLKEELSTMDLYMSIENIRFNNEINYIKQINSTLNLDTIKVPPLLLQPFLENAIWHGLSSKTGEKEIVLSAFKVSKNLIEINITDNGVGRKAAMEIKKNKSLKRKSIGLDLTKERLKTFSNDFIHDFSLKYYDLHDNDGSPKGTKIAIRIPLQ